MTWQSPPCRTISVTGIVSDRTVFKRRSFHRWQRREHVPDQALCTAVNEIERGLVDADLGRNLYKKRVARDNSGKSGGFRMLLAVRFGQRYIFMEGFAKNVMDNIGRQDLAVLQDLGAEFLSADERKLCKLVACGLLIEVRCERYH